MLLAFIMVDNKRLIWCDMCEKKTFFFTWLDFRYQMICLSGKLLHRKALTHQHIFENIEIVGAMKQYRSPAQRWGGVRVLINSGSVKAWHMKKNMDEAPPVLSKNATFFSWSVTNRFYRFQKRSPTGLTKSSTWPMTRGICERLSWTWRATRSKQWCCNSNLKIICWCCKSTTSRRA